VEREAGATAACAERREARAAAATWHAAALEALLAELVIDLALLGVGQDLVRLADLGLAGVTHSPAHLLELLLGGRALVAGVLVWVPLERLLAVRLLDVGLGRVLAETKGLGSVSCDGGAVVGQRTL
jgi:hypothetical protein